jgi:tripartite-type tricarboxylate transporter receptor subunit TctC
MSAHTGREKLDGFSEEEPMKTSLPLVVTALISIVAPSASAQAYPSKPIRLVVPFTPGGGTDAMARVIALRVSETFGQPIVIDNRPGAGGLIGFETVVRAEPDGYTLIVVNSNYSGTSAIQKLPYDPVKDIAPIILLGDTGLVVVVHPSTPVKSVNELIAYAKGNPGKLNYASVGAGSLTHLALELFKLESKVQLTHVPYKGGAPALSAVIGGEVQLTAISAIPTIPQVKAGRLRAIAVTTAKRMALLPDVPAISETVPGYEADHWYGMWGPKRLHRDIVVRWNKEVARVLQTDEMKRRLAAEGLEPAGGPPEEFLKIIRRDVEKWNRVVKDMKIPAAR